MSGFSKERLTTIILTGHSLKPKVIKDMITISKQDKKVWENYVSDFENSVLFLKNNSLKKRKLSNNKIVIKKEKSLNSFKNIKKKKNRTRYKFRSSRLYAIFCKVIFTKFYF